MHLTKKRKIQYEDHTSDKHERIYLDVESWVDKYSLSKELMPTDIQFEELWNLHPENKEIIKIMGKTIQSPRWSQSYGLPYKFSGVTHQSLPLPAILQRYLDHANSYAKHLTMYGEHRFNMCFLNWYQDGTHYIGYHSDDEKEMLEVDGQSLVLSISFGHARQFCLKSKSSKDVVKMNLDHGDVLIMGGKCQKTHKHSITKISGMKAERTGRRISLTFRIFHDV